MSKVLIAVFLIFGTVVGSGFSSGKEIFVFFGRFGKLSFLFILLACVCFFFVFRFFLLHGKNIQNTLKKYKVLRLLVLLVSLVFCASMFAGITNLFSYFGNFQIVLVSLLLLACVLVTARGFSSLEKINLFLMPACAVLFFVVLLCLPKSNTNFEILNSWVGLLYAPLYVALNTCMSAVVISKINLKKKQANLVSLLSCFLIAIFLFFGNFVLQNNGDAFFSEMPFLALAQTNPLTFCLEFVVILVGCFTTLISLCFNIKNFFSGRFATLFAVFLPFAISSLGFSQIVSFLYPLCSVLGVFLLLFFILDCIFSPKG